MPEEIFLKTPRATLAGISEYFKKNARWNSWRNPRKKIMKEPVVNFLKITVEIPWANLEKFLEIFIGQL